jgi:hypothetical protein
MKESVNLKIFPCKGDCLHDLHRSHIDPNALEDSDIYSRMSERLLRLRERFSPAASTDAFHSTHLRIGDVCSLFALDPYNGNKHEGFLSTLGLVDDRLIVEANNGTLQAPPKTYRGNRMS